MDEKALFYTAFAAYGSWATVIAALVVLAFQNATAKNLTSLQIFNQLADTYSSESVTRRRATLAHQLLSDPDTKALDDTLLVFYEHLAFMVKRRILNRELSYNIFGMDVIFYWSALESYIESLRHDFADPLLYDQFEWLKDHFISEGEKRHLHQIHTNPEAIRRFLELEVMLAPDSSRSAVSQ